MSFRTLIEIWFPPDTAPIVSDFLIWFVPVIFLLLAFFYMRDFVKTHFTVIGGTALVFFAAYCWGEVRTEYRDIGGGKLYLGDAIWANLIDLGARNTAKAEAGEITWEECYYRRHNLQEGVDMVIDSAMPGSAFNDAKQEILDKWAERDERLRSLKSALDGGTMSHWAYRLAIDKMDDEPGPFEGYRLARAAERSKWKNQILVPAMYGFFTLLFIGLVRKPVTWLWRHLSGVTGNLAYARMLEGYNFARSFDDLATTHGPLRLAYPILYVGEVPHDLRKSQIDREHPNVIHFSTGSSLYLYSREPSQVMRPSEAPPEKRKFFFHECPAPKPVNSVSVHPRKSIFNTP